jgi:hypothetical protein
MKRRSASTQRTLFQLLLRLPMHRNREGGYIIIVVAGIILVMSSMLIVAEIMSRVDRSTTKASGNSAAGFYAAEAGLTLRAKVIRDKFVGYNVPEGTSPTDWTICRNGGSGGSGDFACDSSLSVQDYLYPDDSTQRIPVTTFVTDTNPRDANGRPIPTSVTIGNNEQFAGLNAQVFRYDVNSVAYDRANEQPTAIVGMSFQSRLVPLFQFAAFYDKDLEILPSPPMTLSGPVHTNGSLYLASATTLTLNGQVSVVSKLYRGRKDNANCEAGTVTAYNGSGTTPMNCSATRTEITNVHPWNGQVRTGVSRVTVPPPEALDPVPTSNYWNRADLRIVLKLDASNNPTGIEIRNANGSVDAGRSNRLMNSCSVTNTTLQNKVSGSNPNQYVNNDFDNLRVASTAGLQVNDFYQIGTDFDSNVISNIDTATGVITLRRQLGHNYQLPNPIAVAGNTLRKAVVSTSDTFYNYREGKYIRMLNVDVQGLLDCIHQQTLQDSGRALNDATEGGLVWYFTVDGPDSGRNVYSAGDDPTDGNNYGVRLYDASILRASVSGAPEIRGLTVVSDQAIYTAGEYTAICSQIGDNVTELIQWR